MGHAARPKNVAYLHAAMADALRAEGYEPEAVPTPA
jgi:hypothetical protein